MSRRRSRRSELAVVGDASSGRSAIAGAGGAGRPGGVGVRREPRVPLASGRHRRCASSDGVEPSWAS
eukprot:14342241-Heterocapsa_arctica.AAC.1